MTRPGIIAVADEHRASLIVLGSHRRTGGSRGTDSAVSPLPWSRTPRPPCWSCARRREAGFVSLTSSRDEPSLSAAVAGLQSIQISLNLPFGMGGISGTWEPDDHERQAAWEMYVELVTRVAVVPLGPDEGLLREALASLYSLFDTTRSILRAHGPGVARPKGDGTYSFGHLAVIVLNDLLRPVLAKWHPLLLDHEANRASDRSQVDHERGWPRAAELRSVLADVRGSLEQYANLLACAAGAPPLHGHVADSPARRKASP